MRSGLLAVVAAMWLLGEPAQAGMAKPMLPSPVSVPPLPPASSAKGLELSRVVADLPDGQVWQYNGGGYACSVSGEKFKWSSGNSEFSVERFKGAFQEELSKFGFSQASPGNLFEENSSSNDLAVGARITNIFSYICGSIIGPYRDTVLIDLEWQIFDPIRREIVAKVKTSGGVERPIGDYNEVQFVLIEAFRENTRILLADPTFRAAVLRSGNPPSLNSPDSTNPIHLTAAGISAPRPIGEVSASVVALFAGNAMGSGFLVSDDGYILTNHHVVGGSTKVRVRWSDGLESTGEVVRSDKRRDVALVKVEPRGRPALAVVRGTPSVGSAVYAVGTPLDEALQNTVTRGIVSANRFIDGFAYIQSDVSIDHGNSGGPLLDEKGRVIGITVIKIAPDDGQRNLNLFIPIGDALDFLALKTGG
jgi:serine protease Do